MTANALQKRNNTKCAMKATIDIIASIGADKFTNYFMRSADVFEQGKHFASHWGLTIEGDFDANEIPSLYAGEIEKSKGNVLFVGIKNVDGKRLGKASVYFKQGVQTVCMRQNEKLDSILFKSMLEQLGYQAETDENMHVISVK